MASISEVVVVQIDRQTKLPTRKGFGTPLILDFEANTVLSSRVETFASPDEVLGVGFTTADEAYKAANSIFSQEQAPEEIKIAKRAPNVAQVETVTIDNVLDNTLYEVTINTVVFSYLSDATATDVEIRDGLIASINGGSEPVTAAPGASNTLTVTADVAGEGFSLTVGANLSDAVTVENVNSATELFEALEFDSDFYFVLTTDRTDKTVLDLAEFVESRVLLFAFDTNDADSKDLGAGVDTTSIFAQLEAQAYDRTFGIWSDDLDSYPASAWVGLQASKDPGSTTWKFKSLNSVASDNLTTQEKKNIQDKNGNVYNEIAGIDITEEGVLFSGEFIDIIRGTDWIVARIQENVYALLIQEDKVPYTNEGIELVALRVREIMEQAVDRSILAGGEEFPVVTVPLVEDTDVFDRAERLLRDVNFSGRYAGAIHKVEIRGTLTV